MVKAIDASQASELPGVRAVLTAQDLPAVELRDVSGVVGLHKTPQPILARGRVRHVGEPVAIVIADNRYLAEDAAETVRVEYEQLPVSTDAGAAATDPAGWLFPDLPGNTVYDEVRSFGDPATAFSSAHTVVEGTYRFDRCCALPLEPRGCVAHFDQGKGDLTFWSSTQGPQLLRSRLAACTGIPEHRVIVCVPEVGGAFGQKIPISPEEVAIALAAMRLGLFVRWTEDRHENLVAAPQARDQVVSLRLAFDEVGTLTAIDADITGDSGAYSFNSASALIEPYLSACTLPGPYRARALRWHVVARVTNKPPVAPYRGVGFCISQAARELLFDEAAKKLSIDRLELRLRNLIDADEMPYETCNGMRYDSGDYPRAIRMVATSAEEERHRLSCQLSPGGEKRLGVGFAAYVEPTGWGSEGLAQVGWDSFPSYDAADITVQPSGHVTVRVGTNSQGQGSETTLAELVAGVLGIPAEDVVVRTGDATSMPVSLGGTRASRTAVVTGGALGIAATKVREEVMRVAGHLLEIDPHDLEIHEGVIAAKGVPTMSIPFREVVAAGFRDVKARPEGIAPTFAAHEFYDPGATYSSGAVGVVVEVDIETGMVEVKKIFAVEDCGTMLNATIVEGQVIGGLVQGLGYALLERAAHDAAGQPQTGSLLDYLPPLATDVPLIDVRHLSSPSPFTWGGIKGVGEAGMIGGPAAIAAAVADAISPSAVSHLPITPARVFEALHQVEQLIVPSLVASLS